MGEHQHSDEVLLQIDRIVENLEIVKTMIKDKQKCISVLNQLAGVGVRLNQTKATIINDHLKSCINENSFKNSAQMQNEIQQLIKVALENPPSGSHH